MPEIEVSPSSRTPRSATISTWRDDLWPYSTAARRLACRVTASIPPQLLARRLIISLGENQIDIAFPLGGQWGMGLGLATRLGPGREAAGNKILAIGTPLASDFFEPQKMSVMRSSTLNPTAWPIRLVAHSTAPSSTKFSATITARLSSGSCVHRPRITASEKAP